MAHPVTFMHVPSRALGACVLAGIERDTRGCLLNDAERFNYYPATPMAVISWIFDGTLHMVEERGPTPRPTLGPVLPRLVFSGPQRYPSVSWSPGEIHALSVGFYPGVSGFGCVSAVRAGLNQAARSVWLCRPRSSLVALVVRVGARPSARPSLASEPPFRSVQAAGRSPSRRRAAHSS